jgi:hypothetical protein
VGKPGKHEHANGAAVRELDLRDHPIPGCREGCENGQVKTDTIVRALEQKMNGRATVDPATVLVTASGAMEGSHGVKRISIQRPTTAK